MEIVRPGDGEVEMIGVPDVEFGLIANPDSPPGDGERAEGQT